MADIYGYRPQAVARDLLAIGSVAGFLLVIHAVVPQAIRNQLAFHHGQLDPVSMYTSGFVHHDTSHLLGNVAGYVAPTVVAYGLCVQARARRWFRLTFVSFLLVLPGLVSLTSYVALGIRYPSINPVTRGFSGVGAAFVGFVLTALVVALGSEYGRPAAQYVGLAIWLWLLVEISVIYSGTLLLPVAAIASLGWGFCGWGLVAEGHGRSLFRGDAGQLATIGLVSLLLSVFVFVLFPAELVNGGAVTNVFAHAAGFLYGILGSSLTYGLTFHDP